MQETISRVHQMELYFDILQNVMQKDPDILKTNGPIRSMLQILLQYYENGQWMKDYEADERGLIPKNIKRGVLSQDGLYDFLDKIAHL